MSEITLKRTKAVLLVGILIALILATAALGVYSLRLRSYIKGIQQTNSGLSKQISTLRSDMEKSNSSHETTQGGLQTSLNELLAAQEALRAAHSTLETNQVELHDAYSALKTSQDEIAKVQVEAQKAIQSLEEENSTNALKGKIWVSFGDSITKGGLWQQLLVDKYGLVHYNLGIGSTTLAGDLKQAMHLDGRIDSIIRRNPDIVTIMGGANDILYESVSIGTSEELRKPICMKNTNTYIGAYGKIIESLLRWKPTLRIIIISPYWAHHNGTQVRPAHSGLTYMDFARASKEVAAYYSLHYVDLFDESGFNQFTMGESPYNIYSGDTIHPNAEGARRIASCVEKALKGLYFEDKE